MCAGVMCIFMRLPFRGMASRLQQRLRTAKKTAALAAGRLGSEKFGMLLLPSLEISDISALPWDIKEAIAAAIMAELYGSQTILDDMKTYNKYIPSY